MPRSEVKMVLTEWQKSFLIAAAHARALELKQGWAEELRQGRMRRSEMIAGIVDLNEAVTQVEKSCGGS